MSGVCRSPLRRYACWLVMALIALACGGRLDPDAPAGGSDLLASPPPDVDAGSRPSVVGDASAPEASSGKVDSGPPLVCSGPLHRCADRCVDDFDVTACGKTCATCTAPVGGKPACVAGECTFTCGGALVACGDDCADLSTSSRHCGACGRECDGTCNAGACEAKVIVTGLQDPADIDTDGSSLFVAERYGKRVLRYDPNGVLLDEWPDPGGPGRVKVAGGYVYWANTAFASTGGLRRRALAGPGPIQQIGTVANDVYSLITNGVDVFASTSGSTEQPGSLLAIDGTTGALRPLTTRPAGVAAIAASATSVYAADVPSTGNASILAVDIASGEVTPLGTTPLGTWVFGGCLWGTNLIYGNIGDGAVRLFPIGGSTPTTLFTASSFRALYCDGAMLYAASGASSVQSEIVRWSLPSGPVERRSSALGIAGGMVRLGTHLFWVNRTEGTVARLPLP